MIREEYNGKDHFASCVRVARLGQDLLDLLGDPIWQRELLKRTLKIFETHYGKDHFNVAAVLTNLGAAYGDLGDQRKKREFLIFVTHHGEDHFHVANTLTNLGNAYTRTQRPRRGEGSS